VRGIRTRPNDLPAPSKLMVPTTITARCRTCAHADHSAHSHREDGIRRVDRRQHRHRAGHVIRNVCVANLNGHPAISIPRG
jgi:hypothetical protein